MNLNQLEIFLKQSLDLNLSDHAINGIQVANRDPVKKIDKIITAVDVSSKMIDLTVEAGGEVLLVHHGIFWGKIFPVTGRHYHLIQKLIDHNLALVAVHLPLDVDTSLGNNISLLRALDLNFDQKFGSYQGIKIIFQGSYQTPISFGELVEKYRNRLGEPLHLIEGNGPIRKVGVCSGGGLFGIEEAVQIGCDAYITGDASHNVYHEVREAGMHLISGGHYHTEVLGIKNLGDKVSQMFSVAHEFIDLPTGL